jgi:hypothetical protein
VKILDCKIVGINKARKVIRKSRILFLVSILLIANLTFSMIDLSELVIDNVQSKNSFKQNLLQANDWWDSEWMYRKEITISSSEIPADLEDFPFLINITDNDLANKVQSDGDDIVFTDEEDNKLDHEIESYIDVNGSLVVWVKIPNLSSTIDTILYMYYGNPSCANQENVEEVWDSDFEAVWHLAETNGGIDAWKDSTGNGYDGTDILMNQSDNGTDFDAQGMINGAVQLDGYNDSINTSLYPTNTSRTLEFWGNFDTLSGDSTVGCHDRANHRFYAGLRGSNAFFGVGDTASADVPVNATTGIWYYISIIANETTASYYLNGQKITSFAYSQSGNSSASFMIGFTNGNEHGYINGFVDEVRVSYIDRSTDWIVTCYNIQKDPNSFYTIGIEEEYEIENQPPNKPTSPLPINGAVEISLNPTISVVAIDNDDDAMKVYFYDASDDSLIGVDINVQNATRAEVQWTGLDYDETYFWYAVANDSEFENTSSVWSFTTESETTQPPEISIIKPQKNRFYFRDKRLFRRVMAKPFIIGHITIKAEAQDDIGIKRVEFYVDDSLKHSANTTDSKGTYSWTFNERTLFFNHRHKISVYAFDTDDNVESDEINVFIINFPLLHPLRP